MSRFLTVALLPLSTPCTTPGVELIFLHAFCILKVHLVCALAQFNIWFHFLVIRFYLLFFLVALEETCTRICSA